jgi:hypothetical protein
VAPRLPEALDKVVRRAIATNPNERYGTAEDLLKGFELACQQIAGTGSGPSQEPVRNEAQSISPAPQKATPRQDGSQEKSELVSLAQSGALPALTLQPAGEQIRPQTRLSFTPEDYNAPTTVFQRPQVVKNLPNSRPPLLRPRPPRAPDPARGPRPRRNKLVLVVSVLTALVLVVFAGMLYYGYQVVDAASVSINFSPRTQTISQIVTFKADPRANSINLSSAVIPARAVTSPTLTSTKSGSTSGQVNCVLGGLGCQQGVSQNDVDNLIAQMQPDLDAQIKQNLESQIRSQHGTQLGAINISTTSTAVPPVNAPGKSVTVTLTEHGSVGYFLNADGTQIARQALNNATTALGAHYKMVEATITIGAFKIRSIDPTSGISTIAVAEGAVALYHFTQEELDAISKGLLGKPVATAQAFLQNQPGIDPATVRINFTSGSKKDNMPGDVQHIKIIPLNPGSMPSVSLTPVTQATLPAGTSTPTLTQTGTPTSN